MMKKNTKQPASKNKGMGFGFADAMFGIKDITAQYGEIGNPDQKLEEYPTENISRPINSNVGKVTQNKVTVVKKEPIAQKQQPVKLENKGIKQPQVFKVTAGKQHENNLAITTSCLIPLQVGQHVFELTTDGEMSQWEYNVFCDGVPVEEIVPNPVVSFNFQATDVKQGGLGNCYCVATIASLAHLPQLLRLRIPDFKKYTESTKSYKVNLFESGKNIQILVDNLFPQVFIKPVGNDVSLMILEKAYAQAYGNFSILNMGHACDSLRDLTGAPTEYIDFKDRELFMYKIKQAFEEKYPLLIATKANVILDKLSPKHSYHILDFKITPQNQIHIKMRDPRGCKYTTFPNSLPNILEEESSNGIFWVNFKTLQENFEVVTSCKVKYGYQYYYKTFKSKQLIENQGSLLMKVGEPIKATITVHQKHKKFFDDKFKYGMIKVLLAQIERKGNKIIPIRTLGAEFKTQQVCCIQADIEPGDYIIIAQACSPNSKPKVMNEAMTVSVYSSNNQPESIQFEAMKGKVSIEPFLMAYIRNNKADFKQTVSDKQLQRYAGPLYGYLCMYYNNRSGKSVMEELTYQVENVTPRDKKVALQPGEEKILLHPIGEANNCSHKFSFKTKTMYKS